MAKAGAGPTAARRIAVAVTAASVTGMSERALYSKSSSSIASRTADTGLPNVAAMPATAPAASSVLRSSAVTGTIWPTSEPSAPPVAMIGPSAPKGPPVPMAIAAESGFRTISRAGMRLRLKSTCSIASGMPCPRIARDPYRAINPTRIPPATGTTTTSAPRWLPAGDEKAAEARP